MKKQIAVILALVLVLSALLTGCSKEVGVNVEALEYITLTGSATTMTKEAYAAILVPEEHYELPEEVAVTVDGVLLTEGYSYDPESGTLTIEAESVTGDIVIAAAATESILGAWETSLDLSQLFNDIMGADPELAEYVNFTGYIMDMTLTFREDGTCSMTVSEESYQLAMENLVEQLKEMLRKMLEDMLEEQNMDMTVDEFLEAADMSLDDLMDQSFDAAMAEDMRESLTSEANYEIRDGVLYISDDLDSEPADGDATPYELVDGTLTIRAGEDADEDMAKYMFPMVLKRAE